MTGLPSASGAVVQPTGSTGSPVEPRVLTPPRAQTFPPSAVVQQEPSSGASKVVAIATQLPELPSSLYTAS